MSDNLILDPYLLILAAKTHSAVLSQKTDETSRTLKKTLDSLTAIVENVENLVGDRIRFANALQQILREVTGLTCEVETELDSLAVAAVRKTSGDLKRLLRELNRLS